MPSRSFASPLLLLVLALPAAARAERVTVRAAGTASVYCFDYSTGYYGYQDRSVDGTWVYTTDTPNSINGGIATFSAVGTSGGVLGDALANYSSAGETLPYDPIYHYGSDVIEFGWSHGDTELWVNAPGAWFADPSELPDAGSADVGWFHYYDPDDVYCDATSGYTLGSGMTLTVTREPDEVSANLVGQVTSNNGNCVGLFPHGLRQTVSWNTGMDGYSGGVGIRDYYSGYVGYEDAFDQTNNGPTAIANADVGGFRVYDDATTDGVNVSMIGDGGEYLSATLDGAAGLWDTTTLPSTLDLAHFTGRSWYYQDGDCNIGGTLTAVTDPDVDPDGDGVVADDTCPAVFDPDDDADGDGLCQDMVGQWTFEPGQTVEDLAGYWADLTLSQAGIIANGRLHVDAPADGAVASLYASSNVYSGPEIGDKTLVAWVEFDDADIGGGSVLTLDHQSLDLWDGLVYGERATGLWTAGSDDYYRSGDDDFAATADSSGLVQVAVSYELTEPYAGVTVTFCDGGTERGSWESPYEAFFSDDDDLEVLFGLRHTYFGTPLGGLSAYIEEARIYDGVLTCAQVAGLEPEFVSDVDLDGLPDSTDTDDDGDGVVDTADCRPLDASASTYVTRYADSDLDGYGVGLGESVCGAISEGYANNADDCNDDSASVSPGDSEVCGNSSDDDCDGAADEGCTPTVVGATVTENAGGGYTVTPSGGSGAAASFPSGTVFGDDAAVTMTAVAGGSILTVSGIDLPEGQTKSITVHPRINRTYAELQWRALYGQRAMQLYQYAPFCVNDSATGLSALPTTTNCGTQYEVGTRALWYHNSAFDFGYTEPFTVINGARQRYNALNYDSPPTRTVTRGALSATLEYTHEAVPVHYYVGPPNWYSNRSYRGVSLTSVSATIGNLSNTQIFLYDDSDADGLVDVDESELYLTNPLDADGDDDGQDDSAEIAIGTDPADASDLADPDADRDGVSYEEEVGLGTDPDLADTDSDGVSDNQELMDGTDPTFAGDSLFEDLDGDGADDRLVDEDADGLTRLDEEAVGTDPTLGDTDGDGVSDGAEVSTYGTDPLDYTDGYTADTDGDGLDDHEDNCAGDENVAQADTDADGLGDACDTDDDGDIVLDDNESCDLDADKLEPGDCGCGTADADADTDGVSDCLEETLTLEGRRSHVYFENGLGVYAAFHGRMELAGGLLAPDFREGLVGPGQIGVELEGGAAYTESVVYAVDAGTSEADNREIWGFRDSATERATLRWKQSETYQSSRDPSIPSLSATDNLGRLVSRFIHDDETRLRFRWNQRTELPLTISIDGVALLTVTEEGETECEDSSTVTCLDGYVVTSTFDVHEVYRDDDGERKRVVDVDYDLDRLGDGNLLAWHADGNPDDGLDNLRHTQEAIDDGTDTSVWFNAGGRFDLTVPITSFAEPSATCPSATLTLQMGDASTAAVIEGAATWTGYDVEHKTQRNRRGTVTKTWTHWRAREVGEDCALDDDTCGEE